MLRPGDTFEFPDNGFEERVLFGAYPPGSSIPLVVERAGTRHTVVLRAGAAETQGPLVTTFTLLFLSFFAVAALLAVQRPDDPRARALASFLAAFPLGVFDLVGTTSADQELLRDVLQPLILAIACHQLLTFATIFPEPALRGFRDVLRRVNLPLALTVAATSLVDNAMGDLLGRVAPHWLAAAPAALFVIYFVLVIASLFGALRDARGVDRQRVLWVALSIGVGFSGSSSTSRPSSSAIIRRGSCTRS